MEVYPLDLDNSDSPVEEKIILQHDLFGNLFIRHHEKLYCVLIDNNKPEVLPIKENKLTPIPEDRVNYGTGKLFSTEKPMEEEISEKIKEQNRLDKEVEEDQEYFPEKKHFKTLKEAFYRDGQVMPFDMIEGNFDPEQFNVNFSEDEDEDEDNRDNDEEDKENDSDKEVGQKNVFYQEGTDLEPFFVFYNFDPKCVSQVGFPSNSIYHFLIAKGNSSSKEYIYLGEEDRTLCPYRLTIFTDGIIKCNVVNEKTSTYKFQVKEGKLSIEI